MARNEMNLQDSFLNQVRKDNTEIQLVLLDGTRLNGLVRGFDNFTVIVNARGQQHLIYKHAIAQIISRRPQHHAEGEHAAAPAPEAPAAEGAAEAGGAAAPSAPQQPPREPRREGRPFPERRDDQRRDQRDHRDNRDRNRGERPDRGPREPRDQHAGPKFNAIDLSQIKVPENPPAES